MKYSFINEGRIGNYHYFTVMQRKASGHANKGENIRYYHYRKCLRTGASACINNLTISMHTPRHLSNRGKVLLFGMRNQPSLVETEVFLSLLKDEGAYLPGIGSIQQLESLKLKF
jgi:hypothetical protein